MADRLGQAFDRMQGLGGAAGAGLRIRIASRLGDREAVQFAETLGRVVRYPIAALVSIAAGMLVLGELGVSVAPILGAAAAALGPHSSRPSLGFASVIWVLMPLQRPNSPDAVRVIPSPHEIRRHAAGRGASRGGARA
jgi:hypothetical protein